MSSRLIPLLLAVLLVLSVSRAGLVPGGPVDECLRKLDKFCRIAAPEQCPSVSKSDAFSALADCCSQTCTSDELLRVCCSVFD